MFEGDNTRVEVSKREESIIKVLKERFLKERCEGEAGGKHLGICVSEPQSLGSLFSSASASSSTK